MSVESPGFPEATDTAAWASYHAARTLAEAHCVTKPYELRKVAKEHCTEMGTADKKSEDAWICGYLDVMEQYWGTRAKNNELIKPKDKQGMGFK